MVEWPEFYTVLGQEMEKMIGGQKTVDEGLHAAQSMLEEIVK